MATRKITLKGPVKWAKVFEGNRDMTGYEGAYAEHDGGYTVDIGLDADNLEILQSAGSMKKGSPGEDGLTWVKLLRKHKDRFEWASGAPKVFDSMGDEWDFTVDGVIPNESEATVVASVYDTSRPRIKGTRLDSVTVNRVAASEEEGAPF